MKIRKDKSSSRCHVSSGRDVGPGQLPCGPPQGSSCSGVKHTLQLADPDPTVQRGVGGCCTAKPKSILPAESGATATAQSTMWLAQVEVPERSRTERGPEPTAVLVPDCRPSPAG